MESAQTAPTAQDIADLVVQMPPRADPVTGIISVRIVKEVVRF
ncbi:MAG: hypothetical protein SGI77_25340 [Pirellulaceae bacterium]|nr:hypothetical protein [Pirellulaceae bacterium]